MTTLVAATALVLACSPAHAGAPTDRLREFFAKVNAILADPTTADRPLERVALVRRLVNDVADVQSAAARALGAEWDRRTAAERDEFVMIFTELLERAYVGRLAGAAASGSMTMTYRDEVRTGDESRVATTLRGAGNDLRVDYVMTLRGSRWRVRDIVVDGVSTVENYRAQFSRVLQHDSYGGLVRQLREKLSSDGRMFAKWVSPATPGPIEQDIPFTMTPADAGGAKGRKPAPAPARVANPAPPREPGPRTAPPEDRVVRPAPAQEHAVRTDPAPPPRPPRVEPPPPRAARPEPVPHGAVRSVPPKHTVVRAEPVEKPAEKPVARLATPPVDATARKAATSDLPSSALAPVVVTPPLDNEPDVLQMALGAIVLGVVGATIAAFLRRRRDPAAPPVPAQVLWGPDEHHRARDLHGVAGSDRERRVSRNGTSHARVGPRDRGLER